jgi:hypothetical protein
MGRVKIKGCYFQLSPMAINNLSIKKGFVNYFFLLHERWNGGWVCYKSKSKTRVPSWVEKVWKANLNQCMDEGSIGCHHWPRLYLFWMVQISKVDMAQFAKCKLKSFGIIFYKIQIIDVKIKVAFLTLLT